MGDNSSSGGAPGCARYVCGYVVVVGVFLYCYCKKKRENSEASEIQMENSMSKTNNTEMSEIRKPMF